MDSSSSRAINCSGACGRIFHFVCVGLNKSHFSSWSAKVGLFWFCDSCRLNFDPAVYEREKTIMKALRELLIRTDSMDTRLGNYGENLRKINKTLYGTQQQSRPTSSSQRQNSFQQSIDELNLDDFIVDPINRSRSCDDTSFFEVLDEVNSSIAVIPDKFVVGSNKRVQIVANPPSSSGVNNKAPRINVSTPAAPEKQSSTSRPSSTLQPNERTTNRSEPSRDKTTGTNVDPPGELIRPSCTLKVAVNVPTLNDSETFYVTPFTPDQTEEEVKSYVMEISNVHSSLVKVTKLVPRGRNIEDLSFVSFKVTVCNNVSSVVGDPWYWPEGINVRPFEPNPKNGSASRLPNMQ